jgi:hypothetical protein
MKYIDAIISIEKGNKAYRESWLGNGKMYIYLKNNNKIPQFTFHNADDTEFNFWRPSVSDLQANDWIIIESQEKSPDY